MRAAQNSRWRDVSSEVELDRSILEEPRQSRSDAVVALMVICFMVCSARSLMLWISSVSGCEDAERDVHDLACVPSLVGMLCPGLLAVGSLCRLFIAPSWCCIEEWTKKCLEGSSYCRPLCYMLTCMCLWVPTLAIHGLGLLLAMKMLADVAKSPLADVLWLWRVPAWEELLVMGSILALWTSLLLLSAVASACLRILQDSDWPLFMTIFSIGCLLMEAMLTAWCFANGERFLPCMLVFVSSISTATLSLLGVGYILYTVASVACVQFHERPAVSYGYLWG